MAQQITPAGWIVADNEVIHSTGQTIEEAWANFYTTMEQANIEIVDEMPETDFAGNWSKRSNFTARSASQRLLNDVESRGGNISWASVGGVCCTREEEEAE